MKMETYEELRARLMRDTEVRRMIEKRAYEIYLDRGTQPGGAAHDWLQAESEVLGQLMEQGSIAGVGGGSRPWASNEAPAKQPRRPRVPKSGVAKVNSSEMKAKDTAPKREAKKKSDDAKKSDKARAKKKKKSDDD